MYYIYEDDKPKNLEAFFVKIFKIVKIQNNQIKIAPIPKLKLIEKEDGQKLAKRKDFEKRELFDAALLQAIRQSGADLVVLAGYLVILPKNVIAAYENRIINIHPSLIPSFCGAGFYGLKVHEGVLARGVKVTGATVHFVDEGTDTGPIILQRAVNVEQGDTPEILQRRVMEQAEWKILPQAIDLIARGKVTVENGKVRIEEERGK